MQSARMNEVEAAVMEVANAGLAALRVGAYDSKRSHDLASDISWIRAILL
jgi:hypothetical protein